MKPAGIGATGSLARLGKAVGALAGAALLLTLLTGAPCQAAPLAVTPFHTFNQSPLVQIFGLPAPENAVVQDPGRLWTLFALDVANSFSDFRTAREFIILDGESYRTTLALRYGIGQKLELGMDLPLVSYSGGVFDTVIEGWHSIFGLDQGGRLQEPRDRLLFSYRRDDREELRLSQSNFGLGDLRLTGAWQLYGGAAPASRAVALRASLKLPTGSSSRLHGSGSIDLALWLTGSDDYLLPKGWGHLTLFAAGGALALTDGGVLPRLQNNLVGFGTFGLGWAPAEWFAAKTQASVHSPFYHSAVRELGQTAVQLVFGGTFGLSDTTALDVALSEDIRVATSPDLALHLALSKRF